MRCNSEKRNRGSCLLARLNGIGSIAAGVLTLQVKTTALAASLAVSS